MNEHPENSPAITSERCKLLLSLTDVQKVRILVDGKPARAYVCAKCLKGHKVQKVA